MLQLTIYLTCLTDFYFIVKYGIECLNLKLAYVYTILLKSSCSDINFLTHLMRKFFDLFRGRSLSDPVITYL